MTESSIDWAATHRRMADGRASLAELLEARGSRLDRLLHERARQLADPPRASLRPVGATPMLVARAGTQRFALGLSGLVGVVAFGSWTPLAGAPGEVIGVVNVRGEIWAAFDLPRLLPGAEHPGTPEGGHLVLLRHHRRRVGLRVDQAEQVRDIAGPGLDRPAAAAASPLTRGVTSEGVIVLDLDAIWMHRAIVGGD